MSAECSADNIPPGYKQTEVGVIPEDWEVKSVQEVAAIKTGPFGTLLKASEYSEGDGMPLISVGEIREGFLKITDQTPRVPERVIRRLPQYVLKKGDIVFGRKGAVERSALIRQQQEGWFLGSDGISVRPIKDLHGEYLSLQFQSSRVKRWLLQNATGTTMPSLNQEILRNVVVPLPPTLAEQEAIAEALSDTDAFIESLEQLIAKKRQIKQGAMQELLTGKRRLQGFGEGKGYKQTEIGVIPEDWSVVDYISFGQVIDGDRGTHYPGACDLQDAGYCLFLNAGNVTKAGFRFSEFQFISTETDKKLNKGKLSRGDVILTTRGTLGNFAYYTDGVPFENIRINSGMVILRNTSQTVTNAYQYLVLRSRIVESQIERLSFGSAQPQLTVKGISTLKIPLPPTVTEQKAIAIILTDMDSEITALEEKLAKARQVKQGMMQELLTGRVRLI